MIGLVFLKVFSLNSIDKKWLIINDMFLNIIKNFEAR